MRAFLAAVLASALSIPALAAEKPPLSAEAMWALKRVGAPAIAPDGKAAVVQVSAFDLKTDKRDADLWLYPTDGGAPRQLTADPAAESEPLFSPDGRWLAFVAKRDADKAAQLYVLPVAGGEARRVTEVPTGVARIRWLPDSRRVTFVTRVWPALPTWEEQEKRLKERDESKMTARVWDKAPISHWDHWIDDREAHIYLADVEAGGAPVAVTRGKGPALLFREPGAFGYDVAPDGREIAYMVDMDPTGVRDNTDIVTIDLADGRTKNVTEANRFNDGAPLYSPDGRWLAYVQQRIYGFYGQNAKPMLLDRKSGTVTGIAEQFDRSATGLEWLPDGSGLIGSIDDAGTQRLYRFDVKGDAPRRLTDGDDVGDVAMAGRVMVGLRQSFSRPPELVRIDPRSGKLTTLSGVNDAALDNVAMGPVESVTYKGADGRDIQMWVIKPPGFDPARKYPLFLLIHGGPHNAVTNGWTWRWNAQVFAGWGYVVAWHNFHGSSGFGQAFTDSINPDRASRPYEDTIKAADWFKAQPWIDSDRMVAGGGSYGGYLTSIVLGREHPFKALVAHAAVYNNFTQIAADYGAEKARFFEFWDDPAAFMATSPHMGAGKFNTPTLVIHGQLDYRVPVNHGIELFNTLQNRGVPSRLIYYPNENHWILKPQNSVFWYGEVRRWIETYAPPNPKPQAGVGTGGGTTGTGAPR